MSIASALGGMNRKKRKPNNKPKDKVEEKKVNSRQSKRDESLVKKRMEVASKLLSEGNVPDAKPLDDVSISTKNKYSGSPKRNSIQLEKGEWYMRLPRLNNVLASLSDGFTLVTNGSPSFILLCKKLQIMPSYIIKDTYIDIPDEVRSFCLPIIEYEDSESIEKTLEAMKNFYKSAYINELPTLKENETDNSSNHHGAMASIDNTIQDVGITNGY